jgi:hypothetical protein
MMRGEARWSYDPDVKAWYFALGERATGPYYDADQGRGDP